MGLLGGFAFAGQLWAEPDKGPEDVNTADVLKKLGIPTEPSVDANGRQLFLPLGPHFEWNRKRHEYNFWFSRYSPEAQLGPDCCSERWVASHYVRYDDMYRMDNLERLQCPLHLSEWPHWGARSVTPPHPHRDSAAPIYPASDPHSVGHFPSQPSVNTQQGCGVPVLPK